MNANGMILAILLGAFVLPPAAAQQAQRSTERPSWVVDGVPDTVLVLVEASASASEDEQAKELLREAEIHARRGIRGHPDDLGPRFGLAVVLGLRANREGGRAQVLAAAELQKELAVILALDPYHARARHMLGRLHAGVRRMNRASRWIAINLLGGGELKKATWEEAERNLAFAAEHAPEVADHHLQLANLYRDTGRPELAVAELERVLALTPTSPLEEDVMKEAIKVKKKLEDDGISHH